MEEIAYIKGISSEGETLLYYVSPKLSLGIS